MNTRIKLTFALFLACCGISAGALATIIPVEEAVETVALQLRLDNDLTGTVSGRSCSGCEQQRFTVTPATQAFENNVQVDLRRALERNGKPATIIYNIRSGDAVKLIWTR